MMCAGIGYRAGFLWEIYRSKERIVVGWALPTIPCMAQSSDWILGAIEMFNVECYLIGLPGLKSPDCSLSEKRLEDGKRGNREFSIWVRYSLR